MSAHGTSYLRPDIQAMRAIAVVAVFVYHLWPARLPGGYTGVDVFFVISGFLITGNLIREAEASGRIRLLRFWSRRMRRLLPAALLVLAVAAVATILFVPQNLWPQFLRETMASTLYVENWLLAGNAVDYLAAENTPSAVQHFWTLSVEEQFYIVTPLFLIGLLVLSRRVTWRRPVMLAGIASITAASFACSIWLTATDGPAAYFVTTTRAWEFGVGALLVFVRPPASVRAARLAVAGGLVAVGTAAVLLSGAVPFPGAIAAWPVLGAASMIWGGATIGGRWAAVAAIRPVRFIGDVSYSIYLWHWPLIVILPYALGHGLGFAGKVAVIAATIVLAGLSTRFVEDPIRYSSRLLGGNRSARAIVGWCAMGMAAVIAVASAGVWLGDARSVTATERAERVVAQSVDCLGAMSKHEGATCTDVIPPDVLVPDPASAATDTYNRPECWSRLDESELRVCSLGPADATIRLAAIGDSHSNAFLPAYERLADENGWRIDVAGHNGCAWTTAVQVKPTTAMVEACEGWKKHVEAWLNAAPPFDAILVTNARSRMLPVVAPGENVIDVAVTGLLEAWAPQQARGTPIIAIRDNPAMAKDVTSCVVRYRDRANDHCSLPRGKALGARDALVEAVERSAGARLIDLTDIYCDADRCLPVIGNVVVYQDRDHMTRTFVRSLAPILFERIRAALP